MKEVLANRDLSSDISIVYCLLYMLFAIYPYVFQKKRGWNAGIGELPLIGIVIGACLGGVICAWGSSKAKERALQGHKPQPEDTLPLAMMGSTLFPIAM